MNKIKIKEENEEVDNNKQLLNPVPGDPTSGSEGLNVLLLPPVITW